MALRLTVALAVVLLLATCRAEDAPTEPETCEGYDEVYGIDDDGLTVVAGPDGSLDTAMLVAKKLAEAVAAEVHKNEDCEVTSWSFELLCRKPVTKDEQLSGGFVSTMDGTLYDAQVVEQITCPDGAFKVRYEVRGTVPQGEEPTEVTNDEGETSMDIKVEEPQTRFIDVFDSTYQRNAL